MPITPPLTCLLDIAGDRYKPTTVQLTGLFLPPRNARWSCADARNNIFLNLIEMAADRNRATKARAKKQKNSSWMLNTLIDKRMSLTPLE